MLTPHTNSALVSRTLLRWTLRRDDTKLVCTLHQRSERSFEVSVIPQWQEGALRECFDAPAAAFERHAEVAALLRDSGWVVTAHTCSRHVSAAA